MLILGLLTLRMLTRSAHPRKTNISRHVSAQRLERAKELLRREDQSLLDIAIALNFSSLANFTRAPSQAHRHAPSQYRRRFERH
jgi:AraC-like DNA-binding protein